MTMRPDYIDRRTVQKCEFWGVLLMRFPEKRSSRVYTPTLIRWMVGWTETVLLSSSDTAWVDVVDESVIGVEWLLDGTPLEADDDTIDIRSLGLGRGEYTLTARAYDTLLNHSFTGDSLDWWRSDPSHLSQSVSWNLSIALPEPSSCLLIGLIGFGQVCRRNRKA